MVLVKADPLICESNCTFHSYITLDPSWKLFSGDETKCLLKLWGQTQGRASHFFPSSYIGMLTKLSTIDHPIDIYAT